MLDHEQFHKNKKVFQHKCIRCFSTYKNLRYQMIIL
uniref:Uncharacterized protein n=1 Tax=Rhizophora mucronata TaxID=61149 RepID=A0A2P2P0E2_RHIMU